MTIPDFLPTLSAGFHSPGSGRACVMAARTNSRGYPTDGGHRKALSLRLGRPVAAGMDACHTCDNRGCVNPAHLYEGTRKQNMADCTARGRHNKPRGEDHWRAKVSAEQVAEMRNLTDEGWTRKALGEKYGIHAATVSRIVRSIWRTEVQA